MTHVLKGTSCTCKQKYTLVHTLEGHEERVYCAAISADSEYIASGSRDCTIRVWSSRTGQELSKITGCESGIVCADFSPDMCHLVAGTADAAIFLWELHEGKPSSEPLTLGRQEDCVNTVKFSHDSDRILSASDDGTVVVWSVGTGAKLLVYRGHGVDQHQQYVYCSAWSPDSGRIASGGGGKTIHVWDACEGGLTTEALAGHTDSVICVVFAAKSSKLVSGSSDKTIIIWELRGSERASIKRRLRGHTSCVRSISLSPDEELLVSCSADMTIRVWGFMYGKQLRVIGEHSDGVWSVVWAPNGRFIVSSSRDKTSCIWRVPEDAQVRWQLAIRAHVQNV
jgi:WD40 repeat protein